MRINLNKIFFWLGASFCFSLFFLLPISVQAKDITEKNILSEINYQRQEKKLQPLSTNSTLSHVADIRAEDMLVNNYFAHQSPNGSMPWDIASNENYNYSILGENLALDYFDTADVMHDWMASLNHKNNILNPQYSETGIAIRQQGDDLIIVQIFAQPRDRYQTLPVSNTYNSINDQSLISIIPNNGESEKYAVLGAYNINNQQIHQNSYISMYNLWLFLLATGFFEISMFLLLIPEKKIKL